MGRLLSELHRLYLPHAAVGLGNEAAEGGLMDGAGRVRALVLELALPADWDELALLWRGVQADLGFAAPGIAVSGIDGLQLWFSLAEAVSAATAHTVLEALRSRYLPDVALNRLILLPVVDAAAPGGFKHAPLVPALQAQTGYWSAFVSADLAPVFADTPWMDIQPGDEGQAGVLRRLASISATVFDAALEQLGVATQPSAAPALVSPADVPPSAVASSADAIASLGPKQFLQQVMNDDSVALALRIEAAKALLPYSDGR